MMNASVASRLHEYWCIVVRRKWLILGSVLLSLVGAAVLYKVLPKTYRSDTLILVEHQKIPESYVKSLVGGSVEGRITMIKQQVMSRTLLTQVIEDLSLIPDKSDPLTLETAIEKLRQSMRVETVGGRRRGSIEAFKVSFSHEDPVTAMRITSRIASKFVEENLKTREQFVEGASQFLDYELVRAKEELEQKEREISEYKSKHMGELPQQMEANLRTLDRLQVDLGSLDESIQRLSGQLPVLETGIREYTETGEASPEVTARHGGPDLLAKRFWELEHKLAILSAEYKDTYPDVVLTKQELDRIKRQLAEKYGEAGAMDNAVVVDPYLRKLTERRDELLREMTYQKERRGRLVERTKAYEKRVEQAPGLEQELLILVRDYGNMTRNYSSLLDKQLNARVAENLEKRQKGEQFRIIDPAHVPGKPYEPNQERIMLLGLAFGCVFGFGLAFGLDQMNPTFRRPEDMELLLGLHVLASVPHFAFVHGRSARKRRRDVPGKAVETTHAVSKHKPVVPEQQQRRLWGAKKKQLSVEMSFVSKWWPRSVVAEQYRVAATQLALLEAGRRSTVVVVSSAVKGEGKTTTVVNLGYTLARDLGKRTLLIDCDFKAPLLASYAETFSDFGLIDLPNGKGSLEECLSSSREIPCWIMSVGSLGQGTNDLSKAQRIGTILTDIRPWFDYILINTPPILPLADMNVLAGMADVLVLVVRAGSTPQDVVQRALNTLKVTTQIHAILNEVEARTLPYYMHYDYYQVRSPEGQPV